MYTGYDTGYILMLTNKEYKSTLSPELLNLYFTQQLLPFNKEAEKSETFSIAIVALSFLFSESYESYYDYLTYKINYKKLYKRMNFLIENKFDENLCDLIVKMLDESSKNRPTYDEILSNLKNLKIKPQKFLITTN